MFRIHDFDMCDMLDENHISAIFTKVWTRIMAERKHDGCSYSKVDKSMLELSIYLNNAFFELVEESAQAMRTGNIY